MLTEYNGIYTDVSMPSDTTAEVKAVENKAFYGDYTLIYVIIPYTVTAIGDCAFFGSCCLKEICKQKTNFKTSESAFCKF